MLCSQLLDGLFWLFVLPAIAASLVSVKRGRRFLDYVEERTQASVAERDAAWPSVALIVPVKGLESGLAGNLRALADQDYPRFDLLVCCSDPDDPAIGVVRSTLGSTQRIVVAGPSPPDTGEKIANLRAAVEAEGGESEVLVFADSDGQVPADWLRKLVAPLDNPELGAATAFRWYFPEQGGFWPLLRSVWDSAIATIMDSRDRSFAWGGGTAIRRSTFDSAKVLEHWKGAVSDDYRLTDALNAAGLGIRFVPEAMVPTVGQCDASEFLAWSVRQVTITRVYRFGMWLGGFLSHVLYCGAQLLCLLQILSGNWIGLGGLLLVVLPGMAMGGMRAYACGLIFPERESWLGRFSWSYFWLTPVATWVWMYAFARSGLTRRIAWRGRAYELVGKSESREIDRP